MDRLTEILARLAASADQPLTDDELAGFEAELTDLFTAIRSGDVDDVDASDAEALGSIVTAVEGLRTEAQSRLAAAAERDEQIAQLAERLAPVAVEGDEDEGEADSDDATDEAEADEAPEADASDDAPAEVEAEAVPELVTAAAPAPAPARPSTRELAARQPAHTRPQAVAARTPRITAFDGRQITTPREMAAAVADQHEATRGAAVGTTKFRAARMHINYPAERCLSAQNSIDTNEDIMDALLADAMNPSYWDDARVASGGFCAPGQVDYGMSNISEAMRPVRDGLPGFRVDEGGGIRVVAQMPTLADVVTSQGVNAAAAVNVWTNATDTDPEGATKGFQTIPCATFVDCTIAAIVRRLRWGVFGQRAFPRQVEVWNELVMAAHARVAETRLLDQIKTGSTANAEAAILGTSRDVLEQVIRHAEGFRSTHRMTRPKARLRVMMPAWVPRMSAVDLIRGEQSDPGFITDAEAIFRAGLANAGVNVTFYVDSPSTGTNQVFDGLTVTGNWPNEIQWGMWEEGHWRFLDGGTYDLGVYSSPDLNDTNDLENFAETFETACESGIESRWITSTVCPDGSSSEPIAVACTS